MMKCYDDFRVGKFCLFLFLIYNFWVVDEMLLCFVFGCNYMIGVKRMCSLFRFLINLKERNKWI